MGILGVIWGILGVFGFIGYALYRLAFIAIDAFNYHFTWYHWFILIFNILFMAYSEGYRGFQKKFSPRVAARILFLKKHPNVFYVVLAPVFCMGYFCASKRTKIVTISLTIGIFLLVLLIRTLEQPWRGIIDAGVVIGLTWGLISLGIFCIKAFTMADFPYEPDVPGYNKN